MEIIRASPTGKEASERWLFCLCGKKQRGDFSRRVTVGVLALPIILARTVVVLGWSWLQMHKREIICSMWLLATEDSFSEVRSISVLGQNSRSGKLVCAICVSKEWPIENQSAGIKLSSSPARTKL